MAREKSTPPAPVVVPDAVYDKYHLYVDKGQIHFFRLWNRFGANPQRRYFTYYLASRELWRVYAKNKQKYKQVPSWHQPYSYIRSHELLPVMPKHLILDRGL